MSALLVRLVRAYQRWLSPMLPPACRFHPTCSEYTATAIAVHGSVRGVGLGLWRIVRCNPLSAGGYDPVPPGRPA
jgi:putative membrane protein insertion efficiency factor